METKEKLKHKTISLKKTFSLPLDKVWKAWTEPESFKKWWGPHNYTCPFCTIDLKVGGKYLASMKANTGEEMYSTGTYKEIIPREKLVVTDSFSDKNGNITPPPENMPGEWPKEMIITVEMQERNSKTEFSLTHEKMPVEMYEDCIKGWEESLDKLEKNLK